MLSREETEAWGKLADAGWGLRGPDVNTSEQELATTLARWFADFCCFVHDRGVIYLSPGSKNAYGVHPGVEGMFKEFSIAGRHEALLAFWSTMAEQLLQEFGTDIALDLLDFQPLDVAGIIAADETWEGWTEEEEEEEEEMFAEETVEGECKQSAPAVPIPMTAP